MQNGFGVFLVLCLAAVPQAPTMAAAATAVAVPVDRLQVGPPVAGEAGIFSLAIRDTDAGSTFEVMFDAGSAEVARASIPVLAAFYRELSELLALDPASVRWSNVLFAHDAEHVQLTRKEGLVVWKVEVGADGKLGDEGLRMLYRVLPHEQVHATQRGGEPGSGLPRWYAEGQATWAGLQVTSRWRPELAREERNTLASAMAETGPSVALSHWGGIQPKPEAILRQLTPEQRAQFMKDPSSVSLSGPFSFGPDDLVSDESNTQARYAASLALFERIDAAAGRNATQAWFKSVREAAPPDNKHLVESAKRATGVDIAKDIE